MNVFRHILCCILAVVSTAVVGQGKVDAQLDSMTIFIGGQVGLNLRVSYPEGQTAVIHQLSDTLTKEVEIVEALPVDTTVSNGMVELFQRYIVTSFDSGLHYIPPVAVLEFEGGEKVSTPDLALNVVNPFQNIVVDEQTQTVSVFDIKDVIDAPFSFAELLMYLPWIFVGLLVIALIVLGIIYYRKYKAKQAGIVVEKPKHVDPCDVVALTELSRIKEEKLWQKNLFKQYYSEITDTLRRYISERYSVNAMESTTDEIMDELKDALKEDVQDRDKLRDVLEVADFVKFAKHEPLPDENDMAIKRAIEFVENTRDAAQAAEKKEAE